jgi:hypothetical protein
MTTFLEMEKCAEFLRNAKNDFYMQTPSESYLLALPPCLSCKEKKQMVY